MKFLDEAKISIRSGKGGPGCLSFHREKNLEFGGPNGGNGGKGGDIYFKAINTLNTLIDFRYQQHYKSENGNNGAGNNKTGSGGNDLIINVPVGTEILDIERDTILADLTKEGQVLKFLKGGDGGYGNSHYKSSTNQAPRRTTPGWPAQEMEIWLRLKLIADVGIVGLPNAGKSTFLSASSNAKPKIADYPFTTLHPNLGVVKVGEMDFVMADIPGLIEGAHGGLGLGDRFLGHVERTNALLHVIDCTQDNLADAYRTIRHELKEYGFDLHKKREIIVINKADAIGTELAKDQAKTLEKEIGKKVNIISAVSGENVKNILFQLATIVYEEKYGKKEEDGAFDPL